MKTPIFILCSKGGFSGSLEGVNLKILLVASPHAPIFLLSYFITQCFQLMSTFTVSPPFLNFVATGLLSIMQNWGLCASMSKSWQLFSDSGVQAEAIITNI